MTTTVLELREVSKVYGTGPAQVNALWQVNLSVRRGELVAVMGPSGSGKSSLLTIAGSLEEPTSGQVLVLGTDLTDLSLNDQARLRRRLIGYVFQDFNLLAGFTAIENVTVPLELDGTSAKAAQRDRDEGPDRAGRCRAGCTISPMSCPAGSASAWRSPARWSVTAGSCSPTSRRVPWTR